MELAIKKLNNKNAWKFNRQFFVQKILSNLGPSAGLAGRNND